jgi:hypothetical protein
MPISDETNLHEGEEKCVVKKAPKRTPAKNRTVLRESPRSAPLNRSASAMESSMSIPALAKRNREEECPTRERILCLQRR